MAAPVLVSSHTAYRGALTIAGDGGLVDLGFMLLAVGSSDPTSWSITLTSGTSGHWTTPTDGTFPTPTSTGDTADLNGGPYVFNVTATNADGTSNTCVLTINIRADTYTISAPGDWTAARGSANSTTLCGKTAEVARAATGFETAGLVVSQHNTTASNTSYHIITNEDNEYPAPIYYVRHRDSSYVKFNNLYTITDRASGSSGHYFIRNDFNGTDVTTMVEINDPVMRGPVGEVENTANGIYIYFTLEGEFTVRNADMTWVANGFATSPGTMKIYNSKVRYFTSNGIQTDSSNLTIHDTIIMSPMRDTSNSVYPGQDHVDFIQFSDNASISHDIQRLWLVQADGTASCTTQSGTLVQGPGVLKNIVSLTANDNAYSPMINRGDNLEVACLTSINQTVYPGMSDTPDAWGDAYEGAGTGGGEPWVRFVNTHTAVTIERVWVGNDVGGTLTGVTLGDGILGWQRYASGGVQAAYDPSLVFQDYAALSTIDYTSTDTDAIIAAIKAALSPDPTGPAKLSDNSYSTALYPDGGWNLALPYATKYTLSASVSEVEADGSVIITANLLDEDDASAVRGVDLVITLEEGGTSGNSGSPQITIPAGESSGQVTATDAGTGTGSWTFTATTPTDLTDPAALDVPVTGGSMALTPGVRYGISLRATETYLDGVGGDPDNVAFANGTVYPVTGVTFAGGSTVCPDHGWSVDRTAADADRSTTSPRTAGLVFVNSSTTDFRVDLPNGDYKIWPAFGDITSTTTNSFMVRDGTGTAFVDQAAGVSVTSGSVLVADGTLQTRADFETTPVELDVTVTQGFITIKAGSSYSQFRLSHIGFMPVASSSSLPVLMNHYLQQGIR